MSRMGIPPAQPTLADLLAQLGEAHELARKAGNLEAMIAASWYQAQLLGYVIERSEVRQVLMPDPAKSESLIVCG